MSKRIPVYSYKRSSGEVVTFDLFEGPLLRVFIAGSQAGDAVTPERHQRKTAPFEWAYRYAKGYEEADKVYASELVEIVEPADNA